jgi:hypothetical protein
MRIPFLFFICVFSLAGFAESAAPSSQDKILKELEPKIQTLGQSLEWKRLLHYKSTIWGETSLVRPASFFASHKGADDPVDEMREFLKIWLSEDSQLPEKNSIECRFPARIYFLRKQIGSLQSQKPRLCPDYQRWYEALHGESVSLIFSSYYLNNPSSTFGHTFLRINKHRQSQNSDRLELLDYGVNFAANSDQSNAFLYALKGLFGGFPGTFTTMPYYYKVREYSNSESRDLWSYELNLSQEVVDQLVRHIWEMGPVYADYWYLSENCSYHMMTLLEAADPSLDLSNQLKKWVIPTDTVQTAFEASGLVKQIQFRPSVRRQLMKRLTYLNHDEIKWLQKTVKNLKGLSSISDFAKNRHRLILDAAIDAVDFKYSQEVQVPTSVPAQFKGELLTMRASLNEISEPLVIPAPEGESPEQGHGSRRAGVGYNNDSLVGSSYLFHYKFAFHDLWDQTLGYPEYAKISFFDLNFAYYQTYLKLDLTQFSLFEVASLSPYGPFTEAPSWRMSIGFVNLITESCIGCRAFGLSGGYGYTWRPWQEPKFDLFGGVKANIYYTADGQGLVTNNTLPRFLVGGGPHVLARLRLGTDWVSILEGWYKQEAQTSFAESKEVSLGLQWSARKNLAVRASAVNRWFEFQNTIDLFGYY